MAHWILSDDTAGDWFQLALNTDSGVVLQIQKSGNEWHVTAYHLTHGQEVGSLESTLWLGRFDNEKDALAYWQSVLQRAGAVE